MQEFAFPIILFVSFYYSEVSGDREVQRTMLELLNQLDGFSSDERIKVSIQPVLYLLHVLIVCLNLCLIAIEKAQEIPLLILI